MYCPGPFLFEDDETMGMTIVREKDGTEDIDLYSGRSNYIKTWIQCPEDGR